jgi:hypothetical protein
MTSYEDMFSVRGFGTMSPSATASIESHPWRMNCKLVMEWQDAGTGAFIYGVCSGAMQDPEVVLTAGHCVYNRDNDSTGQDYGFATRVWVYPGWDGNGLALGTPGTIQNYGWGVSNGMVAWTGYTDGGDFDADIGLVRINRAVGMLTGWYGWRSADWDTCGTLGLFFNNPSFPAEGCGSPGLHNGRDMYNWNGNFDSCQGDNQLRIDTTEGCFTALWGGQSGSNAYDIDDEQPLRPRRRVELEPHHGRPVRQALDRGPRVHERHLQARRAGRRLRSAGAAGPRRPDDDPRRRGDHHRHRPGAQPDQREPGQRDLRVQHVPLDQRQHLDSDTLLADRSFTFDYAAMQNINLNTGNVTIPKNTPSGTYWVGIVLDDQDIAYGNNDSDTLGRDGDHRQRLRRHRRQHLRRPQRHRLPRRHHQRLVQCRERGRRPVQLGHPRLLRLDQHRHLGLRHLPRLREHRHLQRQPDQVGLRERHHPRLAPGQPLHRVHRHRER